jgi:murein DD-endopeptidase MepM/ murein hydrolase activator NlpD
MRGIVSWPRSNFLEHLLRLNGLAAAGFAGWELLAGMRFGEREAWWRGGAPRDAPHEGLDLRGFRGPDGAGARLEPGTRVPVLWAGTLAAVVPDFLGHSVFVAHEGRDGAGRRLHSVYGHVEPRRGLTPGCELREGEEVGAIADPAARVSQVPPHLHLTVALIAVHAPGTLDWSVLRDPARTVLMDPLPLVGR